MSKVFAILKKENGEIVNKKIVRALFDQLKDGRYQVEVSPADKRSNPQNRYYFGLVVPMVQKEFNNRGHDVSKEETHEFLKGKFNYKELVNHDTGEFINIPYSTASLNKEDFSAYIEKIQIWAAEFLHLYLPDPGQQIPLYE